MRTQRLLTGSLLQPELEFSASRSSGPGGQNVNKVNSKITLKFDINNSQILTEDEKRILLTRLVSRLSLAGMLILVSQDKRSQLQNKEAVLVKFEKILSKAFEEKKPRKDTKPSKGSVKERIKKKKQHAEKKQWRQKLT